MLNMEKSGFVYCNRGKIVNCYSAAKLHSRKGQTAGFVFHNHGEIESCFSRSTIQFMKKYKKKSGNGFYAFDKGEITDSFFLGKKVNEKNEYRDSTYLMPKEQATAKTVQDRYQWDYEIFEKKPVASMDFRKENWSYRKDMGKKTVIRIEKESDLLRIIERVNRGESESAHLNYQLTADLNFHGKKVPMFGYDKNHPFCGSFDGQGHVIKGFILSGKKETEAGFFGYLDKAVVMNLTIDYVLEAQGCKYAAAFCVENHGEIHCCEARCELVGADHVGLFVGNNYGVIERCCASGKCKAGFYGWIGYFVPVVALASVVTLNPPAASKEYVPVKEDVAIIPGAPEDDSLRSNENKASYEVPKEIEVSLSTLTAQSESYVIKNPDRGGNYDLVATLYMTNQAGEQVEVYQSGRIPVGYYIDTMTIKEPEGVTFTEGKYDANMQFTFYQSETGEKGMMDSTVPVAITLQ